MRGLRTGTPPPCSVARCNAIRAHGTAPCGDPVNHFVCPEASDQNCYGPDQGSKCAGGGELCDTTSCATAAGADVDGRTITFVNDTDREQTLFITPPGLGSKPTTLGKIAAHGGTFDYIMTAANGRLVKQTKVVNGKTLTYYAFPGGAGVNFGIFPPDEPGVVQNTTLFEINLGGLGGVADYYDISAIPPGSCALQTAKDSADYGYADNLPFKNQGSAACLPVSGSATSTAGAYGMAPASPRWNARTLGSSQDPLRYIAGYPTSMLPVGYPGWTRASISDPRLPPPPVLGAGSADCQPPNPKGKQPCGTGLGFPSFCPEARDEKTGRVLTTKPPNVGEGGARFGCGGGGRCCGTVEAGKDPALCCAPLSKEEAALVAQQGASACCPNVCAAPPGSDQREASVRNAVHYCAHRQSVAKTPGQRGTGYYVGVRVEPVFDRFKGQARDGSCPKRGCYARNDEPFGEGSNMAETCDGYLWPYDDFSGLTQCFATPNYRVTFFNGPDSNVPPDGKKNLVTTVAAVALAAALLAGGALGVSVASKKRRHRRA